MIAKYNVNMTFMANNDVEKMHKMGMTPSKLNYFNVLLRYIEKLINSGYNILTFFMYFKTNIFFLILTHHNKIKI